MKYRLGLDLGTNSIGWGILEEDDNGKVCQIIDSGVRIFNDGRVDKTKSTLAAERRDSRGARRLRDRFLQRQKFLIEQLTQAGLFPQQEESRLKLQKENPLRLRALALSEKLEPYQLGRALFHINQRRGFKSNRKDKSEETTSGKVSRSIQRLLCEMQLIDGDNDSDNAQKSGLDKLASNPQRSYGQFLWERQTAGKPTRARPGYGDKGDLYDVYPNRDLYLDEFHKIWDKQASFYPTLLTNALKQKFKGIIFKQLPLRPQTVGRCTYMPKENRSYRAMPCFQRYRLYQEVNNLEWRDTHGENYKLRDYPDARNAIINLLENPSNKKNPTPNNAEVSFTAIKKIIKEQKITEGNFEFNFEGEKRKGFDSNITSHIMQHDKYIGQQWHDWSLEQQDDFIATILSDASDEDVVKELQERFNLSEEKAKSCIVAPLADGTSSISQKAALYLLEKLRDGISDAEGEIILPTQDKAAACVAAEVPEFIDPMRRPKNSEGDFNPLPQLPYYGEAFRDGRHIIPGTGDEKDKDNDLKYYGGITNPTVHIALNQMQKVVNELICRYKHPHSIAIELGRDLPEGKEYRSQFDKVQAENQTKNHALNGRLEELGITPNKDNRLRLQLWQEQQEVCIYTGEHIGVAELFSNDYEVDHIIPFSFSLDDSTANKVVCTLAANRKKGNQTPWGAFGEQDDWSGIYDRAKDIKCTKKTYNRKKKKWEENKFNNKLWRFEKDALKKWQEDYGDDFLARHLNDNRYISKVAKEYLECICHIDRIDVVTGHLTALLRRHWGLDSLLPAQLEGETGYQKNRNDHRHHAIDAMVIATTNKSTLQKIATAANRAQDIEAHTLFVKDANGKSAIDPWSEFRQDVDTAVDNIIVSHKPRRKKQGQLHKESAYGIIDKELRATHDDTPIKTKVVIRKSINSFETEKHVQEIRNPHLREEFLNAFTTATAIGKKGNDAVQALAKEKGIRHLRVEVTKTIQPIRDKNNAIYKGVELQNNWATEIYETKHPINNTIKWKEVVIPMFEAAKQTFQAGVSHRPHPTAKLIMRLCINDMLEIEINGSKRLMRVHKMSEGDIFICEPQIANVANRAKDLVKSKRCLRCSASTLQTLNAKKVHVSPTGRVRYDQ